ncbi:MAG: DUF2975 domain-containing protein [Pedobacter sp.]
MRDELKFLKVTKVVLVIVAVVAFAITCYQVREGFMKGWKGGAEASVNSKAHHLPLFENNIIPANDSLHFIGSNGSAFYLKTRYQVSGDVYIRQRPQKIISFFYGFKNLLSLSMLAFGVLLLLKLYRFIDDSSKGRIFTLENINRVKIIGVYCILLSFTAFIWDLCSYFIIKEVFSHTSFTTAYSFDFNYLLLTVGIVTIVIMQVFRKGYDLQQDQELTV